MGAVTVITSGKGGVGKSTVTAGLGAALARRGKRVLLIDMEAGLRDLDRIIGMEERLVFDISDVISGNCEPMRAIYPCPPIPGLFILPAPSAAQDAVSEADLRRLIPLLLPYFDHLLFDCPAGVGSDFRASVCMADRALIIVNPDPIGLRCGKLVSAMLRELGISSQRLVINRFEKNNFLQFGFYPDLDAVIDAVGVQLLAVIPEDRHLTRAAADGIPCQPGLPGTMAFDRLAARLEGEHIPVFIE